MANPASEQLQQQKRDTTLKRLDRSVSQKNAATMSMEDLYHLQKDEFQTASAIVQTRQLLCMDQLSACGAMAVRRNAPLPYAQEIQQYESRKKKQSEQEKDAALRAQQKGIVYPIGLTQSMSNAVQAYRNERHENLPSTYRISGTILDGNEFTPNPQTNGVDIGAMLEKRRRLQHQAEQYKLAKKAGQTIPIEVQASLETNTQLLKLLDDAAKTYCAANGVNCDTGELVSNRQQKAAQRHLALAMERYREAMDQKTLTHRLGKNLLDQLKKDESAQYEQLRESHRNREVELDTTSDYLSGIDKLRQWIGNNGKAYAANKKLVDKLYGEYLSCAKAGGELYRETLVLNRLLNNKFGTTYASQGAAAAHALVDDVSLQRSIPLKQRAARLETALRYLLEGREPDDMADLLFLEQHCGIVTQQRQHLKDQEAVAKNWPVFKLQNSQSDRTAYDLELQYNAVRVQYIDTYVKAKRAHEADPGNEVARRTFDRLSRNLNSTHVGDLEEALIAAQEENIRRNMIVHRLMNSKHTGANGQTYTIPNSAAYRDMAQHIMPLGHAHEITDQQLHAACDAYHVLEVGAHLDGSPAMDQIEDAFAHEIQLQRDAMAEMNRFMRDRPEVFDNIFLRPENYLAAYPACQQIHGKSQALATRARTLMRHPLFASLSSAERTEVRGMWAFFHGVTQYSRDVRGRISEQQGYQEGTLAAENMSHYAPTVYARIQQALDGNG